MKTVAIILLSLPLVVMSWVQNSHVSRTRAFTRIKSTKLLVANGADYSSNDEEVTDKPCWQDIWSYDCAMSTAYSASFIPADWIKKLPCALGLAVSSILFVLFSIMISSSFVL